MEDKELKQWVKAIFNLISREHDADNCIGEIVKGIGFLNHKDLDMAWDNEIDTLIKEGYPVDEEFKKEIRPQALISQMFNS